MDVAELFRCPRCRQAKLTSENRQIACTLCGGKFPKKKGYIDLLDASRMGGDPIASSNEQRFMESELVARLYERFWRPAFVRAMAGRGAGGLTGGFTGEFFIHKNSLGMDDRPGPWLDLSCGPGTFARAMAAACPDAWILGLDISRAMLEVAGRRTRGYSNITILRADAHDLPIRDECLGGVNNSGALHAYDNAESVFREVLRVLRTGGLFVGSTFAPSSSIVRRLVGHTAGIRRIAPSELRAWLSRVGFSDYEEVRLGDSYVFRVRKP